MINSKFTDIHSEKKYCPHIKIIMLCVIYFYNFFISAKIHRALIPRDDYEKDDIQTDSNRSAKIALTALDRLIAAWSIAMEYMMDNEDEILN
jgi:hypothetical protein